MAKPKRKLLVLEEESVKHRTWTCSHTINFNNTIITLTDVHGNALSWASSELIQRIKKSNSIRISNGC